MTHVTIGQATVLSSQWRAFQGGPLTDLDAAPSFRVVPLAGGAPVFGPTNVNVQHPATGVYSYAWTPAVAIGDYLAIWSGTSGGDEVEAIEPMEVSSATAAEGPCDWDVDPAALGVCSTWASYTPEVRSSALHLASLYLWAATGRRFGLCPLTVRPAQDPYQPLAYLAYPSWPGQDPVVSGPFLFGGRWFNAGCASACCGQRACAVVLRGPVAAIDEVLVDGDVVPPSAYRVDITKGTYLLVRVDGQCWPICQRFDRETTEPGTFEVSYLIGRALPNALEVVTALLACEYAKALTGGACALPARMTRLTRQGVEIEVEPANPDEGRTGIREVDDVIATLNPTGRHSPPLLLSPDLPEGCDRVTVIPVGGS